MSDRRMFSKSITESDAFTELPFVSQALYLQLSMNADDEGFINNAHRIVKVIGAEKKDLEELVNKAFLIKFDSGIYVIKHWKINNKIRSDRKKETNYPEEKALLTEKKTGVYSLKSDFKELGDKEERQDPQLPSEEQKNDGACMADNDVDNVVRPVSDVEIIDDNVKQVKYEAQTGAHKDYAEKIFDLYFSNQLPCPKDVITFTLRDFRLALQSINELYLSSDDVIAATENYITVVKLGREGKSWWNSEQTFNSFCEKKTILKFLPDNFKIETFYKEKPGANPVEEDKIQL